MFQTLVWRGDRMLLDDLVFRLEHGRNERWELGQECFRFYKTKELIDQYEQLFQRYDEFRPRHVLELGLWDGGSAVFWTECLRPSKLVGVDLSTRGDSEYFGRYVSERDNRDRVKTYWGIDQADRKQLRQIVANEFAGPLDLVIDDASHLYGPTRASFETLFPLLRSGGLYIIEDWAWAHWKEFQDPNHPWAAQREPTALIFELIEATGTAVGLIASTMVCQGFTAVQKGTESVALDGFSLTDYISRRPQLSWPRKQVLRLASGVGRVGKRLVRRGRRFSND